MSNICVISHDEEWALLLAQHPLLLGRAISIESLKADAPLITNPSVLLLALEAEEAESWVSTYRGNAALILLLPKKAEARFQLLSQRWQKENSLQVEIITLPLHLAKLQKALLRHLQASEKIAVTDVCENTWQLLERKSQLKRGELTVALTEKEVLLVRTLLKHQPKSVAKDVLLAEVWQYGRGIDTHTLETHIYRLRQKVGDIAPLIITTDDGYSITGF